VRCVEGGRVLVPNLPIGNALVPETPFRKAWNGLGVAFIESANAVLSRGNRVSQDTCVPNREIGNEGKVFDGITIGLG